MSPKERGGAAVVVLAAVAALLLVAVVVLSVFAVRWHGDVTDTNDETAAGQAALAQAKEDLVQIASYSYKNGAADYADFFDDFSNAKVSKPWLDSASGFKKVIIGTKTVAKASVIDAAYRVVDTHQVEVLAFVDQLSTSDTGKGVSVDQQRIRMTMKQLGGVWKIDNLEYLTHADAQ